MTKRAPVRLTPRKIDAAKAKAKPYRLADAGAPVSGLYLTVSPTGRKAWLSRVTMAAGYVPPSDPDAPLARRPGKRVDVQLGVWPAVSIEEAREKHQRAHAVANEGHDPRRRVALGETLPLFGELMARWLVHLEKAGEMNPRTIAAHRRRWRLYLSNLDGLALEELSRRVIAPELTACAAEAPTVARAALSTLRLALRWAVAHGWIEASPVEGMRASDYGGTPGKPRDVVLSLEELRTVWAGLEETRLDPTTVAAIRLLIITGARRAEVVGMRWEEIDTTHRLWRLPAERTKTAAARAVPLCDEALALLQEVVGVDDAAALPHEGHVFVKDGPGRREPLTPDAVSNAVARWRKQKSGALVALAREKPFTVHDFRRSAATAWGEHLGAAPHVIDALLGHAAPAATVAGYQHQRYEREQAELMRRWGALVRDHVATTAPAENVTVLRRVGH